MPITVLTLLQVVTRSHQRMALLEEQLNAADALLGDGDTGSMPARVFERIAAADVSSTEVLGAAISALARA
jgi:dihydroxyacetone kinase-like protein